MNSRIAVSRTPTRTCVLTKMIFYFCHGFDPREQTIQPSKIPDALFVPGVCVYTYVCNIYICVIPCRTENTNTQSKTESPKKATRQEESPEKSKKQLKKLKINKNKCIFLSFLYCFLFFLVYLVGVLFYFCFFLFFP